MDKNMTGFSCFVCQLGQPLVGSSKILTEEECKALANADVSVFEDQKIVGSAKLAWDPVNKTLTAVGEHAKNTDQTKLRVEVMALLKDRGLMDGVETPRIFDQEKASGAMAEDPDYDPSIPHRLVEVWYDLENWVRYVKNETRVRGDRADVETWLPNYVAMDCVGEHEQPQLLSQDEFERTRLDAKRRHAYCKVKNVRDNKHIYAEDKLLVAMQAAYRGGLPRGKKIKPPTESDFEGDFS